ncbi:MAG: DUF1667 domain-containing protein [Eubacteriales bacterium]
MLREFTCIICPNGCEIEAEVDGTTLQSMEGALCKRGETYVKQELTDPQRNIATSVVVQNGIIPLVSVRLTNAIPKDQIFPMMEAIKTLHLKAPIKAGDVLLHNPLDLDTDVIATKHVPQQTT